jgi:hypothetical protein
MNERKRILQKLTTEGFRLKKWHVALVFVFSLSMTLSEFADLLEIVRSGHNTWIVAAFCVTFILWFVLTGFVAAVLYINYDSLEW